uniref:Olfactory receptor 17 n=2 Tax=Tribolium castaneum TaxID=7070 RepID=C0Z3R4_TRICA|nr:olfactory receptor 17 [Tribolium castaneum]
MSNFSWKAAVETNITTLKILGLWPKGDETYKLNFYTLYAVFGVIGLLCAHSFVQIFNIYFIVDDLEAFTSSIFVTLSCLGTVAKTYYLLQNMQMLKELFISINKDIFQPKNNKQILLVEPSIKFWQRFYLIFRVLCYCTTFFWSSYPILDKWTKDHRLPFLAWYPYDSTKSPFYELTYIHQVVSIWYLVSASLNIDMLIAALNMFVGAQCDLLCDNLRNIGQNSKEIGKNLVKCIEHHREILR